MEWLTTSTLLARLEDFGDGEAWSRFAGRFRQPIIRFARGLGLDETDAEDVAQECLLAFAKAFRGGEYDAAKGRLSSWLFGIAWRQAQGARRNKARREAKLGVPVAEASFWADVPDEQTTTLWDTEWERALLEQCLKQVRLEVEPQTFAAFELVMRHEKSAAEAATELDVPIKLVYNAKHRVLKRVRELREEHEQVRP